MADSETLVQESKTGSETPRAADKSEELSDEAVGSCRCWRRSLNG